jgi:hypothetical protein
MADGLAGAIALVVEESRSGAALQGRRFRLEGDAVVGRDPEADITLPDVRVSRRHARIFVEAGSWWVVDAGSSSGCWLNQCRLVGRQQIRPGDWLQFGGVLLRVVVELQETVPVTGTMAPAGVEAPKAQLVTFSDQVAWLAGNPLSLAPMPLRTLRGLAQRAGAWVGFDELSDHIWPDEAFADPGYVNKYVSYVRSAMLDALGHSPEVAASVHRSVLDHADAYTDADVDPSDHRRLLREFVKARKKVGFRLHQAP